MLNRPFVRLAGDTKITTEFKIRNGQSRNRQIGDSARGLHDPNTRAYRIYIGKQTCLLFGLN